MSNETLPKLAKMIVRRVSKKETQQMIKALRAADLPVKKRSTGIYKLTLKDGRDVFVAMPGRNDYLVRMREDLFTV